MIEPADRMESTASITIIALDRGRTAGAFELLK
jgi:hypothetical protein